MTARKTRVAAPSAEGWFSVEGDDAHLVGSKCRACGTFAFPPATIVCRNPDCDSTELDQVPLSRRGKIWSYTVNRYAPPPPYVAADPFEPFAIAAVELPEEKMVVLGQVVPGADVDALEVGGEVEVVADTLFEDDEHEYLVWKWAPV